MKNLATCKPSEFLKQSNRIKKSVEKWLTVTDILNIRKNVPEMDIDVDEPTEEYKKKIEEQARKNFSAILDSILEEHPDETLELLALLCFVEPKDVDEYPMEEYLQSIAEMLSSKAVIGFFTSLARLERMSTSVA